MNPNISDPSTNTAVAVDDASTDSTVSTLERSARTTEYSRSYSLSSQTTKPSRWGKSSNVELLLKLYSQRNDWKKYGNLTVLCYETFIVAPVKLWWWMAEVFVLTTVMVFAYEFFLTNWVVVLPAVIIAILEWMAFYKTCMRDPGVMPKSEFTDAFKNLISVLATWSGGPGTKRIVAHPNGQQEELHYCWRCHHFRSSQTSHCGTCDCCMILHDHHCPVFGGCVAKNNTSSFHTMIISMGLFWLYMLGICIYKMSSKEAEFKTESLQISSKMWSTMDGTSVTFYLILSELIAVALVPFFVSCLMEMCCKSLRRGSKQTYPNLTVSKEIVNEILQFARNNNFTVQEIMQLTEILKIKELAREVHVEIGSQDVENHNHFFDALGAETQTSI